MKRGFLFFTGVLAVIIMSSSCKVCSTCDYTYTDAAGNQQTFSYDEYCGKKDDVEVYERNAENAAAFYSDGTATCARK